MARSTVAEQVERALDDKQSFLVEAGAGSGKTSTLVHCLRYLLSRHRNELGRHGRHIACITYTNVAKDQISERIGADPLVKVHTIHEFLWILISSFQQPLREVIPGYNSESKRPADLTEWPDDIRITYSDRGRRLTEGAIYHDDVLRLSLRLATARPKLVRIIADRFPYILVDEYQDTAEDTIKLLLDHLAGSGSGRCVVGLFGDSMQKIYPHGVGSVDHPKLIRILKHENYRCAEPIVAVLNKIRPELPQHVTGGPRPGEVHVFLPTTSRDDRERLRAALASLQDRGWSESATKYLMLTHRGIAGQLFYQSILDAFSKRGAFARGTLLDGTAPFARYVLQIEELCTAYGDQDRASLMRLLGRGAMTVTSHARKAEIAQQMRELLGCRETASIGEVFDLVDERRLLKKPPEIRAVQRLLHSKDLDERKQRDANLQRTLRDIPYSEAIAFSHYMNKRTPFTTQHGVKGDEFENVVVVIDDKAWPQFNFGKMLSGEDSGTQRFHRSRNLFYVCCSRAQRRLAVVFMTDLPVGAEDTVRDWFSSGLIHT